MIGRTFMDSHESSFLKYVIIKAGDENGKNLTFL